MRITFVATYLAVNRIGLKTALDINRVIDSCVQKSLNAEVYTSIF